MKSLARLLAIAAVCVCAQAHAQSGETLKIGSLMPMTGPGGVTGLSFVVGVQTAMKEVNDSGGILGRQIVLIQADDAGDPTQGVNEARRLAQSEKVSFVIGSAASTITLAVMPIFTEAKVLQFSSTGANDATPQRGPYHFSTLSSGGEAQALNYIDYALNIAKVKKIAILSDSSPLYRDLTDLMQKIAPARGLTITTAELFDPRTPDLLPHLLRARRGSPDMIWQLGLYPVDTITTMRGLKELKWDVPLSLGLGGGSQASTLPTIMPADQLLPYTGQTFAAVTYCSNTALGDAPLPKLLNRIRPQVPNLDKLVPTSVASGYDTVYILKQVYTATGSFDTPTAARWIENNVDKINSVIFKFAKSPGNAHFLVGEGSMAMAENPHLKRSDGLVKRAGC
jgi:ABC-type branched-subunit amino acid transport system substrate-binding protein